MKKLFLTTGLLSILSVPAMAEVKWFVGGGLGYETPVFSDLVDDLIDDHFYKDNSGALSFNLTGGMRFGEYNKIYNGGFSATFSYMSDLGKLKEDYNNPYYMDVTLDFSTFYFTYDNYIRVSGDSKYRTDFVASIGLGMGWMSEDLQSGSYYESFEDDGMLFVMKFGFVGESKFDGFSWYADLNFISLNADDDADLQGSLGFDVGVKYTF
ncbi:MAG: hypothetical protein IJ517_03355 [Alphaproteobacteria bacterium]|nr:hypothetical protein [Alphaproteobacteria bacterium]